MIDILYKFSFEIFFTLVLSVPEVFILFPLPLQILRNRVYLCFCFWCTTPPAMICVYDDDQQYGWMNSQRRKG